MPTSTEVISMDGPTPSLLPSKGPTPDQVSPSSDSMDSESVEPVEPVGPEPVEPVEPKRSMRKREASSSDMIKPHVRKQRKRNTQTPQKTHPEIPKDDAMKDMTKEETDEPTAMDVDKPLKIENTNPTVSAASENSDKVDTSVDTTVSSTSVPAEESKMAPPKRVFREQVNVGLLIWAVQKSYPWWPAMLTYNPLTGIFRRETKKAGVFQYHVQFFGSEFTRNWVHENSIVLWDGEDSRPTGGRAISNYLKSGYAAALSQTTLASALRTSERLMEYMGHFKVKPADIKGNQLVKEHIHQEHDPNAEEEDVKSKKKDKAAELEIRFEKVKDKNKPKRAMSTYMLFGNEERNKLYLEFPEKKRDDFKFFSSEISRRWKLLTEEQKQPWEELREQDKLRLVKEMETYVPPEPKKIYVKKGSKKELKKNKALKDPNKPKNPMTSYFFFLQQYRVDLGDENFAACEVAKRGGAAWRNLSADEKMVYEAKATIDKGRYREEMLTYVPPVPPAPVVVDPPSPTSKPVPTSSPNDAPAPVATQPKPVAPIAPIKPFVASAIWSLEHGPAERQANESITMDDLSALLAQKWRDLDKVEQQMYEDKATTLADDYTRDLAKYNADLIVYNTEMKAYKALSKAGLETEDTGKRKRKEDQTECTICEDGGDLVLCAGKCRTGFHPYCIGLALIPEDFTCDVCTTGNKRCFVCGEVNGDLQNCGIKSCGKTCHMECAKTLPRSKFNVAEKSGGFICPSHTCANCDLMAAPSHKLVRCIRCPVVYHETCLPAACQKKGPSRIECPRHLNSEKHPSSPMCVICGDGGDLLCCDTCPNVYHVDCVKGTVGFQVPKEGQKWHCQDCIGGTKCMVHDIIWAKYGRYRWWPAQVMLIEECPEIVSRKTREIGDFPIKFLASTDYAWMNTCAVIPWIGGDEKGRFASGSKKNKAFSAALEEGIAFFDVRVAERKMLVDDIRGKVKEKPRAFQRIRMNQYVCPKPPKIDVPECMCDEITGCNESCLNRIMMIECDPRTCPAKSACNNQRMLKRQYPKVREIKTEMRGWGLRTQVDLEPGALVIEYVGEIITPQECTARLKTQSKEGFDAFYMLSIDSGHTIDARLKSNQARFANHSCDPNCITQKWNVAGYWRVGIFAKKYIKTGDEITFDYQLDTLGNVKKKCECGAKNCSGEIGKKAGKEIKPPSLKKPKKKKARVNKVKVAEDAHESNCFQCNTDGDLLMCDFAKCPKVFCLDCLHRKDVPRGKWVCPWHHCDVPDCGRTARIFCERCPNSYCKPAHVYQDQSLTLDPTLKTTSKPFLCFGCNASIAATASVAVAKPEEENQVEPIEVDTKPKITEVGVP